MTAELERPPIEAGPWTRRALLLAFLAPALVLALRAALALADPAGAPATAVWSLVVALAAALAVLTPRMRGLWIDLGRVLLARIALVPLVLLACALLLLALGGAGGLALSALAAMCAVLAIAALLHGLAADPVRTRRRLALLAINAVGVVLVDIAVRVLVLPRRSHNNLFVAHDAQLGWKLRPGVTLVHEYELYTSCETTNSLGFRGPERPFAKPAGTRRVVVLGDSHGEAYTVDDRETWWAELERRLSAEGPVEVISLGVGGYSTDQELLSYLHYGRRFAPDLVILQMCTNDLEYNVLGSYWRGKKPRFERHGEQLLLTGVPVPNLRNSGLFAPELLRASAMLLLLENQLRKAAVERDVAEIADLGEAWKVTELLVRDLAAAVRADGAELAVMNATSKNREFDEPVRALAQRYGLPYLALDAAYADDFKSYWVEGHWNEKGQAAAAAVLAPQVAALLARRAPRAIPAAAPVQR